MCPQYSTCLGKAGTQRQRSNFRASCSFEAFCSAAGECPSEAIMRGLSSYCLQTNQLLTIEKLPFHNSSEPLIQHTRTFDVTQTWHPGGLGWATYWRPTASQVGSATCVGCPADAVQPNACRVIGATLAEVVPQKPTPHGKQYYTIGGDSDGYVFVVMDPVSVNASRNSYMSAWVHVSGSSWDGGNTTSLDGVFVNVWATVLLANGSVTDVHLLQTEGRDIHTMNWDDAPNHVREDAWVQYTADLPATTELATMNFGADVPDVRAQVWFDFFEIACERSPSSVSLSALA